LRDLWCVAGWCGQANESPHHHPHHRPCFFARSNASFKPLKHTHLPTLYRTDSTHRSCTDVCAFKPRGTLWLGLPTARTHSGPPASPPLCLPSPKRCSSWLLLLRLMPPLPHTHAQDLEFSAWTCQRASQQPCLPTSTKVCVWGAKEGGREGSEARGAEAEGGGRVGGWAARGGRGRRESQLGVNFCVPF